DVLLVARFRSLERALPGARVTAIAPEVLRRGRPPHADAVVLDGFVPEIGITVPTLVLAPPPGNAVCPTGRHADDAAVVDWEDAHPLLAGFGGLQAIDVGRVRRLARPDWATVVVQAAATGGG